MQTTLKLSLSCLVCLSLLFLNGCGGGVPRLTPAEQAEVDKLIAEHGTNVIPYYLQNLHVFLSDIEEGPNWGAKVYETIFKILKYLVSNGADVNARCHIDTWTPLHHVVTRGLDFDSVKDGFSVELVNYLVSNGADVNARCLRNGATPLHYAVDIGYNIEIIKCLVSNGADVNARTERGGLMPANATPLDIARHSASHSMSPEITRGIIEFLESVR